MEAARTDLSGLLAGVESGSTDPVDLPLSDLAQTLLATATAHRADLEASADCLRIVARLILLKSGSLLLEPAEEADEESGEQARVPSRDNELLQAARALSGWEASSSFPSAPRSRLVERRKEPRPASVLADGWAMIRKRQEDGNRKLELPTFARLEATVSRILRGLRARGRLSLNRLLRGATRQEAVVHFLAALELSRRYGASVRQNEPFGDILIESPEAGQERDSRAG